MDIFYRTLILLLLTTSAFGQADENNMVAHFIDVGQADATLLEFECGAVLIDAGAMLTFSGEYQKSTEALMNYLNDFFTRRGDLNNTINTIIITHNHFDHTATLKEIAEKYNVQNLVSTTNNLNGDVNSVWENELGIGKDVIFYSEVFDVYPRGLFNNKIDPIRCNTVDPWITVFTGSVEFDPGWGESFGKPLWENPNYNSLVVKVKFGESSFLFTGDLQDKAIDYMINAYKGNEDVFDVDVYQAGHHGSHNATQQNLLNVMTPEIAIISAGESSIKTPGSAYAYGHPNIDVVNMLNSKISRTYTNRNVEVFDSGWDKDTHVNSILSSNIDKAILCTCWDGSIRLKANRFGEIEILNN